MLHKKWAEGFLKNILHFKCVSIWFESSLKLHCSLTVIFNIYSIKASSFPNSNKPCIVCVSPLTINNYGFFKS